MLVATVEVKLLLWRSVVVVLAVLPFVASRRGPPTGCQQAVSCLFFPFGGCDATVLVPWQHAVTDGRFSAVQRGPSRWPWQVLRPLSLISVINGTVVRARSH